MTLIFKLKEKINERKINVIYLVLTSVFVSAASVFKRQVHEHGPGVVHLVLSVLGCHSGG
jgi:hypothetical protein